jgi:hypothetical protein
MTIQLGITRAGQLSSYTGRGKFWRRQFADQETLSQLIFDGTFGVVAPLLCVIFDPLVFQPGVVRPAGLFADYRIFAYTVIFVAITALLVWLVGERAPVHARVLGGIMIFGAVFALVLGLVLLPFSVLGILFYGIGLCGLTPFITMIIYLRNGRRALRHARKLSPSN